MTARRRAEEGVRAVSGEEVGAAYDEVAARYDELVAEDGWMREVLWSHHARVFTAGDRVLDLGCGTGLDTLALAARGVRVTAIDASEAMIARLRAKLESAGLAARVEARVEEARRLAAWPAARQLDGIVSGFAALNTVDLAGFAADARRLVRPGGRLVLHLLAPPGIWARLRRRLGSQKRGAADRERYSRPAVPAHPAAPPPPAEPAPPAAPARPAEPTARALPAEAAAPAPAGAAGPSEPCASEGPDARTREQRAAPGQPAGELIATIGGRPIRHALLPAAETYRRFFAAHFVLRDAYGQGFLWPRRSGRHLPQRLRRGLGRLEARLGRHRPFLDWGRFFVLDLERRDPLGDREVV